MDITLGTGSPAEKDSQVIVHVRGTLNRGEVFLDTRQGQQPLRIELRHRECIAGLRYGIVGMRVGGRREIIVSPHLGYGDEGLPGKVPPNAVLRFDVELLEVRKSGTFKQDDWPPGKRIYFFSPGESKFNVPRIQFGLEDSGRCGLFWTLPREGTTWRHAKPRSSEQQLSESETVALFKEVASLPHAHPDACLSNEQLWADASEKANSVTRDSQTNTACVTIGIQERGDWQCYYSLRKTDPVLLQSRLYNLVNGLTAAFSARETIK